jgi:hypothetical protein
MRRVSHNQDKRQVYLHLHQCWHFYFYPVHFFVYLSIFFYILNNSLSIAFFLNQDPGRFDVLFMMPSLIFIIKK